MYMNKRSFLLVIICALCVVLLASCGNNRELNKAGVPNEASLESATWQDQYDLGIRYLSEENYEDAIAAFTSAIEIDATQALAYVGRGDAYARSGDSEENLAAALADYQAALELDKTLASAWLGLADVYIRQGNYDQALETLQEGLEASGGDQAISDKIAEIEGDSIKDSSGHVRRLNGYNDAGELVWYHIYDYNELGQQSAVTAYNAEGNQISYMELEYDEEGRILKQNDYLIETGEISGYTKYEYDSDGNRMKETFCSLDGTPEVYDVFEYDSNGRCTSYKRYDARDDRLQGEYSFEYDDQGREIRENWTDYLSSETVSGYDIYEYNSDGGRIKSSRYREDGTLIHYIITRYDSDGNYLGEEFYGSDGNLELSTVPSSDAS